jgi:fructokinase
MDQKIICFGEMLWDIMPNGKMPGGAPMNVAVHLHYQGFSPKVVSRVGSDELGLELLNYLKQKQVATDWVQVDEVHPTGTVDANLTDKREVTYEIKPGVAWDFIQTEAALAELVAQSDAFVYGSLAARSELSRATLMELLTQARLRIFDVNLRPPHYAPAHLEPLLEQSDIVKMNHHELKEIAGWYGQEGEEYELMVFMKERFGLKLFLLTRGENGAAALSSGGYFEQEGFPVQVEDTIGSGDAFLASFISGYFAELPLSEILLHACAMGAHVATLIGATPEIDWKVVELMIEEV